MMPSDFTVQHAPLLFLLLCPGLTECPATSAFTNKRGTDLHFMGLYAPRRTEHHVCMSGRLQYSALNSRTTRRTLLSRAPFTSFASNLTQEQRHLIVLGENRRNGWNRPPPVPSFSNHLQNIMNYLAMEKKKRTNDGNNLCDNYPIFAK